VWGHLAGVLSALTPASRPRITTSALPCERSPEVRKRVAPEGVDQIGREKTSPPARLAKEIGGEQSELALQLELCLPRLVSSPAPGGSIDGLRAFSRNPGRRARPGSYSHLTKPLAKRDAQKPPVRFRRSPFPKGRSD